MGNRAEAYDFALFEERSAAALPRENPQPRPQPERRPGGQVVELPQKKPQQRPQAKPKLHLFKFFVAALCFAGIVITVFQVVISQVELTELTQEINNTIDDLDEAKSLEIQLNMQAALRMNDAQVETYAADQLGLTKISGTQVTYVNVAQQDKGAVLQDIDGGSVLDKLLSAVRTLFAS